MKKTFFAAKIILGIAAIASTSVFAEANTVRTCQLTQWCSLPRVSDVANFPIRKIDGVNYDCTLVSEGDSAGVQISSFGGFNTETKVLGVAAKHSAIGSVVGEFQNSSKGMLHFRRVEYGSNSPKIFIMCEKKFTP